MVGVAEFCVRVLRLTDAAQLVVSTGVVDLTWQGLLAVLACGPSAADWCRSCGGWCLGCLRRDVLVLCDSVVPVCELLHCGWVEGYELHAYGGRCGVLSQPVDHECDRCPRVLYFRIACRYHLGPDSLVDCDVFLERHSVCELCLFCLLFEVFLSSALAVSRCAVIAFSRSYGVGSLVGVSTRLAISLGMLVMLLLSSTCLAR